MSATRQSDQPKMSADLGRIAGTMEPLKNKVSGSGTFDGYEVTGWRYTDTASWHVKVWLAGRPGDWIGYTVTAGKFELNMLAQAQKEEAVLHLIRQWDAQEPNLSV
jgi:hypothetical protein